MPSILIAGGGFAAVWAAASAARERLEAGASHHDLPISVVSPRDQLVIRPRLYEANPGSMAVPFDRILPTIGVEHVAGRVEEIDAAARTIGIRLNDGRAVREPFARLVLATGSGLVSPPETLLGSEMFHDVDTIEGAVALEDHLRALAERPPVPGQNTAVVVGAGFVGLEIATELTGRLRELRKEHADASPVRVVLVEQASEIGPELGSGPRPAIMEALAGLGVELHLGTSVTSFDGRCVTLGEAATVEACTVVWTAGMRAEGLTGQVSGRRDGLGRVVVDADMRVAEEPSIYVAGDTAAVEVEPGRSAPQSCQYAHQLGKVAGHNAVADLLGRQRVLLQPDPYVTCLDLGEAGAVYTKGYAREVHATGTAAKEVKEMVNTRLIYPPLDDAEAIFRRAAPEFEWRPVAPDAG